MYCIDTVQDLYEMLDRYTEGVDWDSFYTLRDKPAPFLKYSDIPDQCIVDFLETHTVKTACEFGCGEGRNSIYLANRGIQTDAFDLSGTAIQNARKKAADAHTEAVTFQTGNIFALDFSGKQYDLIVDSGVFHHLPPHRRLQYRELVSKLLSPEGYFILLCFAAGEGGAEEVDDCEFYRSRQTGAAFTTDRLRTFWGGHLHIRELRKGRDILTPNAWETHYLYICVLQKAAF